MTDRHTRYQGLIIQNHQLLLILHGSLSGKWSHWVLPGGGLETGETPEECVIREMKEETGLDVEVVRLVLDEPDHPDSTYQRRKSYLCQVVSGEPAPGFEPELEASSVYAITAIRWLDLDDEGTWGPEIQEDPYIYPQLKRIQKLLGYNIKPGDC
ncbi:MAG: NUDIX domain-containing protein [Anaerolineales bacterium]